MWYELLKFSAKLFPDLHSEPGYSELDCSLKLTSRQPRTVSKSTSLLSMRLKATRMWTWPCVKGKAMSSSCCSFTVPAMTNGRGSHCSTTAFS